MTEEGIIHRLSVCTLMPSSSDESSITAWPRTYTGGDNPAPIATAARLPMSLSLKSSHFNPQPFCRAEASAAPPRPAMKFRLSCSHHMAVSIHNASITTTSDCAGHAFV